MRAANPPAAPAAKTAHELPRCQKYRARDGYCVFYRQKRILPIETPGFMSWSNFIRRYHMRFEGGYRYLDQCGAFMLEAEERFDLFPTEEAKPTGVRMEKPEAGAVLTLDVAEFNLVEELSGQSDDEFVSLAIGLASLAIDRIGPRAVSSRMFRVSSVFPMDSLDQALSYTASLGHGYQSDLGKRLGMTPGYKKIDYVFTSGSIDVNVIVVATTFESVTSRRVTAGVRATKSQHRRAERITARTDALKVPARYAVLLEVGTTEHDPPLEDAPFLFERLRKYDTLIKAFLPPP